MPSDRSLFQTVIAIVGFCAILSLPVDLAYAAEGDPDYVGSALCAGCHQDQVLDWSGSDHALAWTAPNSGHLKGDFDNARFQHDGVGYVFRRKNSSYLIDVTEKDGNRVTYPLHSVAGIAPLQQYLIETQPGRLQSFDVAWDVENSQWYHLYPDQDLPAGDGLHWSGPYKSWNGRCAECHATNYQRNYGARTKTYRSSQAEIGVGCESCHGPASKHLDWANGTAQQPPELDQFGLIAQPKTQAGVLNQCAGCHSRREALTNGTSPVGTDFHDAYNLALLRPGLYQPDGQILDEVYVYGSFLQSKMFAKGVSCVKCHNPHSTTLKAQGNALCSQCHSLAGNPEFPSLRLASYDGPTHSHHPKDSPGAQCKSCHMAERTYMGIDGRRDHSFRIPRPDLGAQIGSTDACTQCHSDQTQDWAAGEIANWFPNPARRGAHFGQVFAQARQHPTQVSGALQDIAKDPNQAGIVRATALYLMQPVMTSELATDTADLLSDLDPLVRRSAAEVQRAAPVADRLSRLMPILLDNHLSVRIAAAKQLLDVPATALSRSQQAVLGVALKEWQRSLATKQDSPETHLVLGGMALTLRNFQAAQAAFATVVELDPQRGEAWVMLVRLASTLQGAPQAKEVLSQALAELPSHPPLLQLQSELDR